jgi:septal ring factor EnvC (AmiA/AmiB activator)
MKDFAGIIIRLVFVAVFLSVTVPAQESRQERAANLRAQLAEVQGKETELQTRLEQIEEQIKPENIERSLAGIGSTHPEELREQRRRQLEIEKKGVQSQLATLAASRTRLEAAIATADAMSYQSSGPGTGSGPSLGSSPTINIPTVKSKAHRSHKHRVKKRARH